MRAVFEVDPKNLLEQARTGNQRSKAFKVGAVMCGVNWRLAVPEITAIIADAARVLSLARDYEAWIASASAPDVPIFLLYTSGITGAPKGAELTHRNLSYTARLSGETWGFTPASVNLVAMPMFHIGRIGYGMSAVIAGGHNVLMREADPAWSKRIHPA